jgi:hypothetical protein
MIIAPPSAGGATWRRPLCWLTALLIVGVFVALRARWIGHLLFWDEAMHLLTTRALYGGGTDGYSPWFWRHPPLLGILSLLLEPLRAGYAERTEWLTLALGTAGLIPLFLLNRRAFGPGVALASLGFLAVMPGAVFYGTWIKEEPVVILGGLTALLCFDRRRYWLAGLALGVAFLGKELAIFYALAVAALWWLRSPQERHWRDLAATAAATVLTAGWWFVCFSVTLRHFWRLTTGSVQGESSDWARPWSFYFTKLPGDLGWAGLVVLVAGAVLAGVLLWQGRRRAGAAADDATATPSPLSIWPLALLLPGLAVITVARLKGSWFTVTFYPAMATLQGLALVSLLRALPRWLPERPRLAWLLGAAVTAATVIVFLSPRLADSYEALAARQERNLLTGSQTSALAARVMNTLVQDDDRVLLTPMHYWHLKEVVPCPIFAYYFRPVQVVVRPFDLTYAEFADTVRKYRIHWAMLSPPPDPGVRELLNPIVQRLGLRPVFNAGVCVFHTTPLWQPQEAKKGEPEAAGIRARNVRDGSPIAVPQGKLNPD